MSDDESFATAIQALAAARITGANPIGRAIAGAFQAIIEGLVELQSGDRDPRGPQILNARLMAAAATLEAVQPDIWDAWCAVPKNEFMALFHEALAPLPFA